MWQETAFPVWRLAFGVFRSRSGSCRSVRGDHGVSWESRFGLILFGTYLSSVLRYASGMAFVVALLLKLMSWKQHSAKAIVLVGVALSFAALVINAQGGGLAFDRPGNLYVVAAHSVSKFTIDGTKNAFATGFQEPLGLCFDNKGNLLVSDLGSNSIYKLTPPGTKSIFARGISSVGMALDRSGNLFVSKGDSIFKISPEGKKSTFVSGLGNPIDLAFDRAGNLFVADLEVSDARVGRKILKFSPDGTQNGFVSGLEDPSAIAVDEAGNVFVAEVTAADASSHTILKFISDGQKNIFASGLGFARPEGLAFDRSGHLFAVTEHAILEFDSSGTQATFASEWVSPDKKWEYRCADGQWPEIVKTGTTQVVLDLSQDLSAPHPASARVVWAPDSNRFAFNYSPPHKAHTTYETIAFYQLREDKWVPLASPVNAESESTQLAQLGKDHLPKAVYRRHGEPRADILKVLSWTDANTATLYAASDPVGRSGATFLFTLRFDDEGNSKIIDARKLSEKELEELGE